MGEIEQRLQVIITVMMFFPVLVDALFGISGESREVFGTIIMKWGFLASFYLIFYLLFQHFKKNKIEGVLVKINTYCLAPLWLLVFLMVLLSVYPKTMPFFPQIILGCLIWLIFFSPLFFTLFLFEDKIMLSLKNKLN